MLPCLDSLFGHNITIVFSNGATLVESFSIEVLLYLTVKNIQYTRSIFLLKFVMAAETIRNEQQDMISSVSYDTM